MELGKKPLDGKVAVVTGAGTGLGRAEAIRLAQAGACVVVNDVGSSRGGLGNSAEPADSVVDEIRTAGGTATANYSDVGNSDSAKELLDSSSTSNGKSPTRPARTRPPLPGSVP